MARRKIYKICLVCGGQIKNRRPQAVYHITCYLAKAKQDLIERKIKIRNENERQLYNSKI